MLTRTFGPAFTKKLAEAGLSLPISYSADQIHGRDALTHEQDQALQAVIDDLDPYGEMKFELALYAETKRFQIETGGITVSGIPVATDDRSKLMVLGARIAAQETPSLTKNWKGSDGQFSSLNATEIIAISEAVDSHVTDCFDVEAQIAAGIADRTITTTEQIDALLATISLVY